MACFAPTTTGPKHRTPRIPRSFVYTKKKFGKGQDINDCRQENCKVLSSLHKNKNLNHHGTTQRRKNTSFPWFRCGSVVVPFIIPRSVLAVFRLCNPPGITSKVCHLISHPLPSWYATSQASSPKNGTRHLFSARSLPVPTASFVHQGQERRVKRKEWP